MLFGVVIGPVTEYLHTRAHTHTHRQNPSQTTSHTRNKTTTTTTVPMVGLLYSPKFQFGPSITYDKSTIYPSTSDHVGQAFHLSRLLTPAEPPRTPIVWDHDGHALETRRTSMGTVWTLEMWSLHPLCKLGKTCRWLEAERETRSLLVGASSNGTVRSWANPWSLCSDVPGRSFLLHRDATEEFTGAAVGPFDLVWGGVCVLFLCLLSVLFGTRLESHALRVGMVKDRLSHRMWSHARPPFLNGMTRQ